MISNDNNTDGFKEKPIRNMYLYLYHYCAELLYIARNEGVDEEIYNYINDLRSIIHGPSANLREIKLAKQVLSILDELIHKLEPMRALASYQLALNMRDKFIKFMSSEGPSRS
jgi:hypothetical protein